MNKPIKDYTLGEVFNICKEFGDCRNNCPFAEANGLTCKVSECPAEWNLSDPPRWTPEEVERAKAIKVLWPNAKTLRNDGSTCTVDWFKDMGGITSCGMVFLSGAQFPSLHCNETVALDDIIKEEQK